MRQFDWTAFRYMERQADSSRERENDTMDLSREKRERLLRDKIFLRIIQSIGLRPSDLKRREEATRRSRYGSRTLAMLSEMDRKRRREKWKRAIDVYETELKRIEENSSSSSSKAIKRVQEPTDAFAIDDRREDEIARSKRKRQIERRARKRLERAKEKREKMHAVVRRRHEMTLREIEEKRAARESLKEDIASSKARMNERARRRAERRIDRSREVDREERERRIRYVRRI